MIFRGTIGGTPVAIHSKNGVNKVVDEEGKKVENHSYFVKEFNRMINRCHLNGYSYYYTEDMWGNVLTEVWI